MGQVWWIIFLILCGYNVCAKSVTPLPPYEEAFLERTEYHLPKMPYNYSALEPYIDEATMRVHHLGHHATYTRQLNQVLSDWRETKEEKELASKSIVEILKQIDKVPSKFQYHIRNVGGGFVSHSIYWATMSPNPDGVERKPGPLMTWLIENTFETFERFEKWAKHEAAGLFGSGNLWFCVNPAFPNHVTLLSLHNQDTPFGQGLFPILLIDIWEHAYYLKHQNKRADYIDAWWKLVNWEAVEVLIEKWGLTQIHDEL